MGLYGIDLEELRTLLKFDGITVDYTDDELEVLVKSKITELEGYIGIDIYPHDYTSNTRDLTDTVYELPHYPISQVAYIYLNDKPLSSDDYNVDYNRGIIYLKESLVPYKIHHHYHFRSRTYYPHRTNHIHHHHRTRIRVMYSTGVDEKVWTYKILPLVKDMVAYTISYANTNSKLNGLAGFVNNLREGDLSMSFGSLSGSNGGDTDYGYSPKINGRINSLAREYKYSARIKWI